MPSRKSFAVIGIRSVLTTRPVPSSIAPPPARNSPRMRAIANETAANIVAKPRNMNPAPTCFSEAIVSASGFVAAISSARTIPMMTPTAKKPSAIRNIGSHSTRPIRCGRLRSSA